MEPMNLAREYVLSKDIPTLFESLMTGLMYNKPDDHITFLRDCLSNLQPGDTIKWNTFIERKNVLSPLPNGNVNKTIAENKPLPPIISPMATASSTPSPILLSREKPLPPIACELARLQECKIVALIDSSAMWTQHMMVYYGVQSIDVSSLSNKSSDNVIQYITRALKPTTQVILLTAMPNNPEAIISICKKVDFIAVCYQRYNTHIKQLELLDCGDVIKVKTELDLDLVMIDHAPRRIPFVETESRISLRPNQRIVFVLGGPGSGKGVQCTKLSNSHHSFYHMSAGQLLRNAVECDHEYAPLISGVMEQGKIVPQEITISLIKDIILRNPDTSYFLIDGFPRHISQALAFEHQVSGPWKILYFKCSDEVLTERVLHRKDGRQDDTLKTLKKRLKIFHSQSLPVITHYKEQDADVVVEINAEQSINSINSEVRKVFDIEGTDLVFMIGDPEVRSKHSKMFCEIYHLNVIDCTHQMSAVTLKGCMESDTKPLILNGFPQTLAQYKAFVNEVGHPSCILNCSSMGMIKSKFAGEPEPEPELTKTLEETETVKEVTASGDKAAEAVGLVPVVFVIGGPGCGKGTQCSMLVEKYGLGHLSTGDLLRADVASGSERGKQLEEVMKEGKLVDEAVILELLEENIKKQKKMVLLDGFPRELEQAKTFESKICSPAYVLYFHCEEETMVARLLERAKTSGRADDNEETIKKRLHTFTTATAPVTQCYRDRGTLCQVDAHGEKEAIFQCVEKGLNLCPKVCFVIGGPGSGKGTQCEMLVQNYGLKHFSSGDLLRAEVASGSDRGKELESIMKEGKLVDMDTVLELLKEAVEKSFAEDPDKLILLDGFPRELEQAKMFEEKICPATFVLSFDCSEATMTSRLLARAETSGRADDNEETIKKRLVTFTESTKPVLDAYKVKGTLLNISAEDDKDTIYSNTCTGLCLS